ncbi:BRO-N domain-containing protein [Bacteroides hominis]
MNPTVNQQATGLQVFYNEEANVNIRTEVVNNEPWFVAKDICDALGLQDVSMTVKRLDEDEKLVQTVFVSGQNREVWTVNESGLYGLIFQSRKPEAKAFRKWVTNVVLPSIRRTGSYSSNGVQSPIEEPSKKLPLPKYRPFFENWKGCVNPYLSYVEAYAVAKNLNVSYSHVRKVFMGTAVSERVARALTEKALDNKRRGVAYEPQRPVYEQLSIEWENKVVTL